jgi:hypothetical protein
MKHAVNMHFNSNMQKYAKKKKFAMESTRYETLTFIIKIILGEL